jgi:CspA family cold shock protein
VSDHAVKEQVVAKVVAKETGRVKWFNPAKGFGFLCTPGNREGIFCHFSQIQVEGYKTLDQDEEVEFEVAESPKGPQAVNVVPKRK